MSDIEEEDTDVEVEADEQFEDVEADPDADADDESSIDLDDFDNLEDEDDDDDAETVADENADDAADDDFEFNIIDKNETGNTLTKNVIIIKPENRKTSNILQDYELTEAIIIRSAQIEKRQQALTDVEGLDDAEKMAEKEIDDGKCPLILRRKVGEVTKDGVLHEYYEDWNINEMAKPLLKD